MQSIEVDDILVEDPVFVLLREVLGEADQEVESPAVAGPGLGQITDWPVAPVHQPGHSEDL